MQAQVDIVYPVSVCQECGQGFGKMGARRGRCNRCYIQFRKAAKAAGEFVSMNPRLSLHDRLLNKTAAGPGGCLIWTAQLDHKGYGRIGVEGRTRIAHRVSYELFVGPIPDGLMIDHLCHNLDTDCPGGLCLHRRCINPHHLEPVTHRVNQLRSANTLPGSYARATHCINGHAFDSVNTRLDPRGRRKCRTCERNRAPKPKSIETPCAHVSRAGNECTRPLGHDGGHFSDPRRWGQ